MPSSHASRRLRGMRIAQPVGHRDAVGVAGALQGVVVVHRQVQGDPLVVAQAQAAGSRTSPGGRCRAMSSCPW